ncbi:MAG: hypothetical protein LBC74_04415 [Planctomycetaceae bacterium]|jgi:methyl-accepting chemotaxis protein|nr:hypothetical protein [Planctomycetaceae bacterium]
MKSIIVTLFIFLFLSVIHADDAATEWQNIDPSDKTALEQLLREHPDAAVAPLAFAARYAIETNNPTIAGYNEFLKKYPDRLQSQVALQNVFELYRRENHAAGYADFIRRYPNTQQAYIAKLHLQSLMAEFVTLLDKEEEYDHYLETFPDAPQIPQLAELAYKKAWETQNQKFSQSQDQKGDANEIVVEWGNWITEYNRKYGKDQAPIIANGERLAAAYRIQRYEKIITAVYKRFDAALEVRRENRHRELIAKLDSIQETLNKNNEVLVKTLRDEFAKTRQVLKQGFAQLGNKLDILSQKMDVLHDDMVQVHKDLQEIHIELKDIGKSIKETNRRLAKLDEHLQEVNQTLVTIDAEIKNGFARVEQSVWKASEQIVADNQQMFDNISRQITTNNKQPLKAKSFFGRCLEKVVGTLTQPLEYVPIIGEAMSNSIKTIGGWTGDKISNAIFPDSQVPVPNSREFAKQLYNKAYTDVKEKFDDVMPGGKNLIEIADAVFRNDKSRALQVARCFARDNDLPPSLADLILNSSNEEELQTNIAMVGKELMLNPGTLQFVMDYVQ